MLLALLASLGGCGDEGTGQVGAPEEGEAAQSSSQK